MITEPRQQALILSKGSIFYRQWPSEGSDFPAGSGTNIVFYTFDGSVLVSIDGVCTAKALTYFITDLTTLDSIPAGVQYELYVTTPSDGWYKIEFGFVQRREAAVWTIPAKAI